MKKFNENHGKKLSAEDAAEFLFGGNALFTIKSTSTGRHMTFKVTQSKDGNVFFVRVSWNEGTTYVGFVSKLSPWKLVQGKKGLSPDTDSFKVAKWVFEHLGRKERKNLNGAEFWHHGHCGKCGRILTDPESISRGIGPICAGKVNMIAA